jgi:kexin
MMSFTAGAGVGIRINDVGVDATHPDFASKFDVDSSCAVYLPLFLDAGSSHGTTCAAIAAASANDECSVGIAPGATLSGCRAIGEDASLESEGDFFLIAHMENMHVSSNSIGGQACGPAGSRRRRLQATCPFLPNAFPCLDVSSCADVDWAAPQPSLGCEQDIIDYCSNPFNFETDVEGCTEFLDLFVECNYASSPEEILAFIRGVTEGRQGKGIIFVFASGNEFFYGEIGSQQGRFVNTRLTISVAAVGKDGLHSTYSTADTGVFISAPGGDFEYYSNNVVALAGGGCHQAGVGTSFATPVVSGVVALVLEVNPELTWRDVQGVLASSASLTDPDDTSWVTNAAGFHHSDLYGFGLVNASAAVAAAEEWELYSPERMIVAQSGQSE